LAHLSAVRGVHVLTEGLQKQSVVETTQRRGRYRVARPDEREPAVVEKSVDRHFQLSKMADLEILFCWSRWPNSTRRSTKYPQNYGVRLLLGATDRAVGHFRSKCWLASVFWTN